MTYEAQIPLYIEPKLGDAPLVLFVREAAQRLEPFYARLRKCRGLCNGRPFVEKHAEEGSARLRADWLQAARLQALRSVERSLHPRDPVRRVQRGRAMGLDQLQPDGVGPAAVKAETHPAAADERPYGAHRGSRVAGIGGVGSGWTRITSAAPTGCC